jgi:DNA polymerase-3 subunit alpha
MSVFIKLKTEYSITKSTITVKEGVSIAKKLGYKSVLLADDDNLFGALDFSLEATKNGILPIIGVSISVEFQNELHKITLVAKTNEGFCNLLALTYCKISLEEVKNKKAGVLAICESSNEKLVQELANTFNEGDLYLEISRFSNKREEVEREEQLLNLALNFNIPIIYSNDAYFQTPDMFEAEDILRCIGEGRFLLEEQREKLSINHYFKSPEEIKELFHDLPEALETAGNLPFKISFVPRPSKPLLPSFAKDERLEMEEKARKGLNERLESGEAIGFLSGKFTREDYEKRLEYETEVISKMGFCGYFLIVADFIVWSKSNGIPVGPGRGSGAGSIIAYSLKITDVDPLYYGLLFERFLNPDRVSMPDFDVDFCQEGRERVIDYVKQKYGETNVAGIITFGRLQARAVLKDVGRVLQIPYMVVDKICKLIPFNPVEPVSLEKAISLDPELQAQKESDDTIAKLLEFGLKLEGLIRHSSAHAAGVIIADRPLLNLVPLFRAEEEGLPVVGYHMKAAEMAGLVKFDFLGLKTLTIIANACKMVKEQLGITLEMSKIPLTDAKTFELLQNGLTLGVFQLESLVCRDAMKKMKIDKIEDIIALTSLNRPGPMENIPSFISRKLGTEQISYPHQKLEELLKETYGIIIYQEQVIKIAQILAGYTLGEADLLRRAMGKKIKEEMDAQRKIFIAGAVKNGVDENKASEIFDLVDKFAGYGFNKSHAAAYTIISYQTAYLKAHFQAQFFVSNLNMSIADTDDLNLFISDARNMGIKINLPCINTSQAYFTTDGKEIFYGLGALKSVGIGSMEEVVGIRKNGGNFTDIFDFCKRVGHKNANKKQLESLTKAGAFDCLKVNRKQILESIEILTNFASAPADNFAEMSLFGEEEKVNPKLKTVNGDFTEQEKLMNEFDSVGFYLSFHPLNSYLAKLEAGGFTSFRNLEEALGFEREKRFLMAGVVSLVKQRSGARGRFAFVHLSEVSGIFEASIFKDELITKHRDDLIVGKLLAIKVSVSRNGETGSLRIIINDISKLEDTLLNVKEKLVNVKEKTIKQNSPLNELPISQEEVYTPKILVLKLEDAKPDFALDFWESVKKLQKGETVIYIKQGEVKLRLEGAYKIPQSFIYNLKSIGLSLFDFH